MAADQFLIIKEIEGESTDKKHKGAIDVLAWSWGMSSSGSFHMGSGGGAGKASYQDLSITKYMDLGSPTLMLYLSKGDHFPDATLICRKSGGAKIEYWTMKMSKVLITSVSTGGSGGEDRLTENVTLNFAEVDIKYKVQKEDGTEGPSKDFAWDIAGNDTAG